MRIIIHAGGVCSSFGSARRSTSSAPKARSVRFVEGKTELSGGSGTLEFVAEVPEVFRSDLELQNFLDHRREVSQRPDRTERRGIGRSRRTPRRREYQRVLNCGQRHVAVIHLSRKNGPHGAPRGQCPASDDTHREPAAHTRTGPSTVNLSPAARAATGR